MIDYIESFGRYPKTFHKKAENFLWISDSPDFSDESTDYLPYGMGKSYGDSCLNPEGILINTRYLNRIISFDSQEGILRVEAGITLEDCIDFLIPRGWFLPVTPGTKFITVGGAVANDVHGKNHHIAGTFGCHVQQFELLRSDLSRTMCSPLENMDLFNATIGGMGLTGLITWVEFKCLKCHGPMIEMDSIKFGDFEEFFEINNESSYFDYTVAWVDTNSYGSGIYSRGNFALENLQESHLKFPKKMLPFPFDLELINPLSVFIFNKLYAFKQVERKVHQVVHYNPFFYPLDSVNGWNKVYGKKGFLQYQFVLPHSAGIGALKEIFRLITSSGNSSFLTVLKTFGNIKSPGMMSFPRPGITMAIDFKMTGNKILDILEESDKVVRECGGVLYPAKDARMSGENFRYFYPQWKDFSEYIDPKFSSGFWKRVMEEKI